MCCVQTVHVSRFLWITALDDNRPYDRINDISSRLAALISDEVRDQEGLHPPTLLAGAGFIVGEVLLRTSGMDLNGSGEEGQQTVVQSDWVGRHGANLVTLMQGWLTAQGITIADPAAAFAAYKTDIHPNREPAHVAAAVRPGITEMFEAAGIGLEDRVMATALAAIRLILSVRPVLHPTIGSAIVMDSFVLGARMVPLESEKTPIPPELSLIERAKSTLH